MKKKWPIFLPDIENYTAKDWLGWFSLVMIIGAIMFGILGLLT